jgi:hypothetical protein
MSFLFRPGDVWVSKETNTIGKVRDDGSHLVEDRRSFLWGKTCTARIIPLEDMPLDAEHLFTGDMRVRLKKLVQILDAYTLENL